MPYPRVVPGADAHYEIDEELDLTAIQPMIAKPFSPGNAFPATEVAHEKLTFDKAMIGSCTNGGYDDLLQAALVLRAARAGGATHVAKGTEFVDVPGLGPRGKTDRERRPAARRRVDRARLRERRRRDPRLVVRPVLRPGPRRVRRPANAPSRRSIATGRTAWASAARATSRARPSSRRARCSATWRRLLRWGWCGSRRSSRSRRARVRVVRGASHGGRRATSGSRARAKPGQPTAPTARPRPLPRRRAR